MDILRKSLSTLCAILFVATGVASLFLFNFDRNAFTAETYQKAFARGDFYNKIPAVMAEAMISSGADQSQFPSIIQGMSADAWDGFFRSLLPPETLKLMGDGVLNSTFAYINMEADTVTLALIPLKTSMTSDTGVQAVLSLLNTLPECTLIQIGQITTNLLTGGQIEFCNPPVEFYPMLAPVIQGQMQLTAAVIPDQLVLVSAPPQNDPRQRLQFIRILMRLSPILPLVFLLGLTVFAVRSLKDWLQWWGVPFLVTGVTAFVMGLIGVPIFGTALQGILINRMPDYLPVILLDYASDLASAMVQALLNPVMIQSLVLAAIGAGMTGIGYFLKTTK